jgi:hypothetical protein
MQPLGPQGREGKFSLGFTYNIGFPVGSVHDFTSQASGLGFEFLGKYWVMEQLTVGADVDWQTFVDSRPRTTTQIDHGAVTATAYNSVQLGALRAGADYYVETGTPLMPYAGLNLGFAWSTFETSAADITLYDNQESFIVGGELGAALNFGKEVPILLIGGRYSYQPSAEFLDTVTDMQTITIQLGLMSP